MGVEAKFALDLKFTLTSSLGRVMDERAKGGLMTSEQRAGERITEVVTSWKGVTAGPGRRGELAFKVGGREIGHLHGDHAAHLAFPKEVWATLFDQGRIDFHPVFPGRPGFGARRIESEADVDDVIALLRLNYDRVVGRHGLPNEAAA
jgi:hypothetical protein